MSTKKKHRHKGLTGSHRETRSSASCFLSYFCQSASKWKRSNLIYKPHTPKIRLLFAVFLFFYEKFCCVSFLCIDSFIVENKMEAVWDWKEMIFYLSIYQQDKMMMTDINELSETTSSLRSTANAFAKTSEHPVQACLRWEILIITHKPFS